MLKLYRGLVDILITQGQEFDGELKNHIRQFNDGITQDNNFGIKGFWNFLLEITMIMFVKLFIATGILLTVSLAIVFFPLYGLKVMTGNILNHRATPFPMEHIEPVEDKK